MTKKIETKVADALLQRPQEINIGGKIYQVPVPTVATLVLISEQISKLPTYNQDNNMLKEVLNKAKDSKALGDIAAIFILGAKAINKPINKVINKKKRLANKILENHTPKELNEIIFASIKSMQVADFFALSVFLKEVSLTKETRETEIVSGQ